MEKLPMSRARLFPLLAASFILLFSCVFDAPRAEQPQVESPTPLSERLSIDDARVFFEESGHILNIGDSGTRSDDDLPEPQILWEDAIYSEFLGYEVIEAQIGNMGGATYYDGDSALSGLAEGIAPPLNTVFHVISGLNSNDEVRFRVVHLVPETSFLTSVEIPLFHLRLWDTIDNYSGAIHLYEVTGEYVKGFIISEGRLTHYLFPDSTVYVCDDFPEDGEEVTIVSFVALGPLGPYDEDNDLFYGGDGIPVVVGGKKDTLVWKFDWTIFDVDDPFDNSGRGDNYGGGGGGTTPPPQKCSVCDKQPCVCCAECGKYPCICCTVCHKNPCECKEPVDPCENLRMKLQDPFFMDIMENLKSKTGKDFTKEYGYKFKLGPNGEYIFSNLIEGSDTDQTIRFKGGLYGEGSDTKYDGCIHSHYPGCGNVFSFGDLPFIARAAGAASNLMSFMYGLATENGYYFLTITDMSAYSQWYYNLFPGGDPNMDEITLWELMFNEFYGINQSDYGFHEDDETALAKYLMFHNVGLSLMKYNPTHNRFEYLKYLIGLDGLYKEWCPDN